MRVLMVSQYFAPERTAASFRLAPLAAGLAAMGHDVEVICQRPSHPEGIVHPSYGRRIVDRRSRDGYEAAHVWTWTTPSRHPVQRLASYGTYAVMASLVAAGAERPDVVVASSPPLSVGVVGALAARRFSVPWVLDVRDLWPDVAAAVGQVASDGIALRFARALERGLYRRATAVTTPTEAMRRELAARGADRTEVVANGASDVCLAVGSEEVSRDEAGIPPDRFVWTYAGNVGLTQGLESAVAAAERLGGAFQLLVVGDGASRSRLERLADSLPEGTVVFRDPVDAPVAARIMRASDALLVSLADSPVLGKTLPVKLYDSCAVRRPVVVAAPGEPRRVAIETGAGLTVAPGDADALAEAVRRLADDERLRDSLAEAGRRFALEHTREREAAVLDGILRSVIA